MKRLLKRFLDWLHYLRHPATDVNITFTHRGGYEYKQAIADVLIERHKTGKSLTDGVMEEAEKRMEEANLLPAMEQRAEEREQEREASLRSAIDWPIGEPFEFGKPDTSMMYRFLEEAEDGTEHSY